MSKAVNVAIIGAGLVGSAFINQLKSLKNNAITFNVIMIARSKTALVSKSYSPLSLANWESDLSASTEPAGSFGEIADFLKQSPLPVILVDNTSNQALAEAYPSFVEHGISIATPNKKAFSSDKSLWDAIWNASAQPKGGLVYHEASVGAGLPIISTLRDLVATGDEIVKVEGIVSGSLSFIFNTFSTTSSTGEVKFSDVVQTAKELGYTEPDPRDDLNGLDAARKATIIARLSGFNVQSPTQLPIQSLIPKDLESVATGEEYMSRLPNYDQEIETVRQEAAKENKVLRYVIKVDMEANTATVGIEKFESSHPFAGLKGSDNVIAFTTKRYPNPLIVQGAGAGDEVTAAGVLGDVLKIADRLV
ncbi:hypothetical protein NADFUDRAFT_45979 [Nadsonia fulvescens var. elongata DSM 6958]|uniref:Homoserine dehydrogenase n=1 Tax=Nadsonia fulvescens var. elongata DSM 6958 TaxID=857566 RepID=A0A1E3PNM6_9ASCO|nr:hypothetical protein NADFUDRAFT_45979 [Nadsonia fulvescens var. elongata DSM 6958]